MPDVMDDLARLIASGLDAAQPNVIGTLSRLFGDRYHRRHLDQKSAGKPAGLRDAFGLAKDDGDSVPYAGLTNPDTPPTGPYGGMSLAWFPTKDDGSLLTFVVGTRGLAPDEGILTRPGHRRRIEGLRRTLSAAGATVWSKSDPAAIGVPIPRAASSIFPAFDHVFKRYGHHIYFAAHVSGSGVNARDLVAAVFDLYAHERGWQVLKEATAEYNQSIGGLLASVFANPTEDEVERLLRARRFLVLQGPPGTGKTRMAERIKAVRFKGHGKTIQFHPSVTYEDFVVGLAPHVKSDSLAFTVRPGWLLEAAVQAGAEPFLLVIDEINRADLGKVLGEAIYLFEPDDPDRTVGLAHAVNGRRDFGLPKNLYILATLNTADRSIAAMDLAIRRRFAFMTLMPERGPVEATGLEFGMRTFDALSNVFVEHAPDDALSLMPGHSYFLAKDAAELHRRFRYELLPLLDEYLREGLLGPASTDLKAQRDAIDDEIR